MKDIEEGSVADMEKALSEPRVGVFRRALHRIRQHFCQHKCHLNELRRTESGVECPCIHCGKTLTGHYGLMLDCDWIQVKTKE